MKKRDLLSRLVTPTGTKGCASHVGAGCTFCPGWCSRLGNRDNSGFPTRTNQRFCSSDGPSTQAPHRRHIYDVGATAGGGFPQVKQQGRHGGGEQEHGGRVALTGERLALLLVPWWHRGEIREGATIIECEGR